MAVYKRGGNTLLTSTSAGDRNRDVTGSRARCPTGMRSVQVLDTVWTLTPNGDSEENLERAVNSSNSA